jgi:hypothetical protein
MATLVRCDTRSGFLEPGFWPSYRAEVAEHRQQVLILYLANSSLDSRVVSWARYDGTGKEPHMPGDADQPPYASGVHALCDGWRLIQLSQLLPPYPGQEFTVSYQRYECVFEKWLAVDAGA